MSLVQLTNLFEKAENKDIDLVGVSLTSPEIDNSMIEAPGVQIVNNKFFGALTIAFSPVGDRQFSQLNKIADDLAKEGTGKKEQDIVDEDIIDPEEVALGEYTPKGNVFMVTFDIEPEIVKQLSINNFVLNGMKYTEASIERELTGKKNITIHLLFKEHDDSHAFFSGLLNQKLTRATVFKLLSLISGSNLSSLPITYVARADKYTASALMPITGSIEVIEGESGYTFTGDTGSISLYKAGIKDAVIEKDKDGLYKMAIKTGNSGVVIVGLHQ